MAIELGQMLGDLVTEQFGSHRLIVEGLVQLPTHRRRELSGEADTAVVARNGVLHIVHWEVARIAASMLFPTAEEVEIFATSTPDSSL